MRVFKGLVAVYLTIFVSFTPMLRADSDPQTPLISYDSRFHPTLARNGIVVSQEENASKAGLEILEAGGNAVDAAVATGFALAVTHPQAGNLGGGGFMMVYLAETDEVIAIDYREMAPAAATRDMFLGPDGKVDNGLARFSLKASGVPGTVMGLVDAHKKYGRLALKDVMKPAIKLAKEGFTVTWYLADSLDRYGKRLLNDPASKGYFYKAGGEPYKAGELLKQTDLATTLALIAKNGADGFYKGPIADKIVATMQAGGGLITYDDLENYVVKYRTPVRGTFRDTEIITMPPPSSGGVHVVEMLNVLEGFDLKAMGHGSAAYTNHVAEAMKYAYADRSKYLGDPDYFDVPVDALTDKTYAAHIRSKIKSGVATPSTEIGPAPVLPYESNETTHFSVVDKFGNMVANTYTLNFTYGNSHSVAGAGFLLNNEMDDFSAKPGVPNAFGLLGGEANAIEAGKRPLSSMTPTFVFKDGKPLIATGSPGGSTIITIVLHMILNTVEFDMNLQEATNRPRFHHQWHPDQIFMEGGVSLDTRLALSAMGYKLNTKADDRARIIGAAQSVMILPDGTYAGAADPRRPGSYAAAY